MKFLVKTLKWLMSGRERRALREAPRQTAATLDGAPIGRLLVLCHGNIFRSPFVSTYLAMLLRERGLDIDIETAGFHPHPGRPSPASYVEQCLALGVDLSEHRSREVNVDMTREADAIVIMDARNWMLLSRLDPGAAGKVIWLGLMDGEGTEVMDPWGREPGEQARILARLKDVTERLAARLSARMPGGASSA